MGVAECEISELPPDMHLFRHCHGINGVEFPLPRSPQTYDACRRWKLVVVTLEWDYLEGRSPELARS